MAKSSSAAHPRRDVPATRPGGRSPLPPSAEGCADNEPLIRVHPDLEKRLSDEREAQLRSVCAQEMEQCGWPEIARLIERSQHGRANRLACEADEEGVMRIEVDFVFWVKKEAGRAGKP